MTLFVLLTVFSISLAHILHPPPPERPPLKFGQCLSMSSSYLFIGANAYSNYSGALYIHSPPPHPYPPRPFRLSPPDSQPALPKRPSVLRPVQRGSAFAFSCASSSSLLIVGAPGHDMQRGAVYVYNSLDEEWSQLAHLQPHNARAGDSFGWSVAVGEGVVAIGAKGRRANNGAVYLYECAIGGCKDNKTVLEPPDITDEQGPKGIRIRNNYGSSVAVSGNGKVVVVGSTGYREERGAAYVYEKDDGNWIMNKRLESGAAEKYGFFGFKVAVDYSGDRIVIGADGEQDYRGAVYVFTRTENGDFKVDRVIKKGKREREDNFGGSVAISGNGKRIVVGAPGIDGKGIGGGDHGVVYVFEEGRRSWKVVREIRLPDKQMEDGVLFGWSVGISGKGDWVLGGAPDGGGGVGVVSVDRVKSTSWFGAKDEL